MSITLSIIVVNYKTPELTLSCVRSIYANAPQVPFEVIVLDNGSDGSLENELLSAFPAARFLETGSNTGFARAVNLGIQNSHGRYVLLLNSDACISDAALEDMVRYMEGNPRAGVVGPRHVDHEGSFQLSCGKFPTFFTEIVRKLIYYRLSIKDYKLRDYLDGKHSASGPVDWVSGSCLLIRREVLAQTGLLDERFFMYFEDVDLCARVRLKGWEVHYFAGRSISHIGGASVKSNLLFALIENRRSQLYFSRKYYGLTGETVIRLILVAKYGFNLLKWGLLFLIYVPVGRRGRDLTDPYVMALLAKKVIMTALGPNIAVPAEPMLQSSGRNAPSDRPEEAPFLAPPSAPRLAARSGHSSDGFENA